MTQTYPSLLTAAEAAELHELADLREDAEAHRDGVGHLAEDKMHAGQPIHVEYSHQDDEAIYHLQRTHQGMPLWFCPSDLALTIGKPDGSEPTRCVKCGTEGDLGPVVYEGRVYCKSWSAFDDDRYDGPCLIAGSDGCDCTDD